jgi:sulfur relay (sulfurtransferase) complex TusBCD TusD component (DsrE family)
LSEALAEKKEKGSLLARWEGEARVGAKTSGLKLKCCVATVRARGAQKETLVEAAGKGKRGIDKIYTPVSRARGVY